MRGRSAAAAGGLVLALLGALTSAVAEPTVGPCEANDAGGTTATASRMGTPAACIGTLEIGDADVFAFEVSPNLTIALKVTVSHGTSAGVTLRDPSASDRTAACNQVMLCSVPKAAGGRWTFGIVHRAGVGGRYGVQLVLGAPAPEASCETAGDAPNSSGGAQGVTPPLACTGSISPAGDTDWYTFKVGAGGSIWASTSRTTTGGQFFLYAMGPNGVRSCTQSAANVCLIGNPEPGTWWIGVRALSAAGTGEYALTLMVSGTPDVTPTTCEPQEAGASESAATVVTSPTACTARIAEATDRDVFAFDLAGSDTDVMAVALTVLPQNGAEFDVTMTDARGADVPCASERAVVCAVRKPAGNGRWHVRVARATPGYYALGLVAVNTNPQTIPETVDRAIRNAVAPTTCEPTDAVLASLPWTSPTESATVCRGSVAGEDAEDAYAFPVRANSAVVRVVLQPESQTADLLLALRPPPGACAPEDQVDGACPEVVSTIGRAGQPDLIEHAVPSGGKSGPWTVRIGRADGEGGYTLSLAVQDR